MKPVPNLGPGGRRRRLLGGLVGYLLAVGLAVSLAGAPPALRALIFLPLLVAGYGVFQSRERT